MRKEILITLMAVTIFSYGPVLAAEKMKEPSVEYSADMVMETEQGTINSRVYHAVGGKERQEMKQAGRTNIMIARSDKKVAWMLMPEEKMYMEKSFEDSKKEAGRDVRECSTDLKPVGSEVVNGVTATKNQISMTCPDRARYAGQMWITKEGIIVKTDAVAADKKSRIKIDLKNLKIAKQDPSLFEVPSGYKKFSMGGMLGDMMKGKQMPEERPEPATPQQQNEKEGDYAADPGTGRDNASQPRETEMDNTAQPSDKKGVTETINKLKGLFGL